MKTFLRPANQLILTGCLFVTAAILPGSTWAQGDRLVTATASSVNTNITQAVERIEMLVKSSRILTLEERIPKFQVHNEEIVGAQPISQNQIQISAKQPGTTQLNIWDTDEKLYTVDVIVLADSREVEGILESQLPLASLKVMPIGSGAVVSGFVTSVDDVDRAMAIVEQFYTAPVNNIQVSGVQQIMLHTKIMEVSRTKLRDLGIDWSISDGTSFYHQGPTTLSNVANSIGTGLDPSDSAVSDMTNRFFFANANFEALIRALRQNNLLKLLAEPTVVATHGRPSRFTVGGRVPNVVPTGNGAVQVEYEEYGTSVDFLPFVVGPGRVRLEVRPEVSEPDESRSVTVNGLSVSAFTQRYVDVAVEMDAGQTIAIAGLLQSRVDAYVRSTPFFGELPYIGTMFRRVRERKNEIELLIMVTPEIVDAMDPCEVPPGGPGLNSMSPTDCELYFDGYIETPNLMGHQCKEDCREGSIMVNGHPTAMQGDMTSSGGSIVSGETLPPGVYAPGEMPTVVGEGVVISSPGE
ncbi:pilus assembly protein N-terminal domain-containing protein [Crateriforma conspicua]|uniref:Type II secretion system protein D n=1 Tax=Crateriforma conspicua TaxID=2527996 RepID=A0A5C5Y9E5_9PLAN|nr:pilus assembly protein N-terminal domain-containing protein [Crateriforma conspicua]QDV61769.1 Type II secretion system protein D precursor [Crateriforma conspicua]TWT71980.1 Type II secretion system protein D precursor [Crateriforma conspicua]